MSALTGKEAWEWPVTSLDLEKKKHTYKTIKNKINAYVLMDMIEIQVN